MKIWIMTVLIGASSHALAGSLANEYQQREADEFRAAQQAEVDTQVNACLSLIQKQGTRTGAAVLQTEIHGIRNGFINYLYGSLSDGRVCSCQIEATKKIVNCR
jgi:hypothetical protein